MFIDELARQYQTTKDNVLKLLEANGIEPIFGLGIGDVGYITEKQYQAIEKDLLKIEIRTLQWDVEFYRELAQKKTPGSVGCQEQHITKD